MANNPKPPSISDIQSPVLANPFLNTDAREVISNATSIYHNGITFNFSAPGVTWGRYISGDPWVLVSGPGVTLTSIEPGLTMVATGVTWYDYAPGKTLMINGSALNKKASSDGFFRTTWGMTFAGNTAQPFDQRDNKFGSVGVFYQAGSFSQGITVGTALGLSYGDMIISSICSFDPNNSVLQSNGKYLPNDPPFTDLRYSLGSGSAGGRSLIKQYSILSAVKTIPSIDSYRPPLFWPNPKTRPQFSETGAAGTSGYARNVNDYLISFSGSTANLRTMTGETLSSNLVTQGIQNWTDVITRSFNSSWVWLGNGDYPNFNGGHDSMQPAPFTFLSGWLPNILNNYIYPHFSGIFIKEIPYHVRQKALRRITQLGIDSYGALMDGARNTQHGGQGQCYYLPWVRFAGWLFNNPTMLNIENNSKLADYFAAGLSASANLTNPSFPKALYNADRTYWNRSFGFAEYTLYHLAYANGATANGEFNKWFNVTNDVGIPYDQGITYSLGYPNGFTGPVPITATNPKLLFGHAGMTGVGSFFKYSGITLNPVLPAETVLQCPVGPNTANVVQGKFGKLYLSDRFRPRIPAESSGLKRATHPEIGGYAQARTTNYVPYSGQILKITDGGGSGPTEYRIVRLDGIHPGPEIFPFGTTYNVSITLDRPFQNGTPDATSIISIYPYSSTDKFPTPIYAALQYFTSFGITFANAFQGGSPQAICPNGRYSAKDYFTTNGLTTLRCYSVLKHLGITQDQFLYNYQDMVYFDRDTPRWTQYHKFGGDNGTFNPADFTGLIIARMRGLTQGTYMGPLGLTFGLDLPGFTAQ